MNEGKNIFESVRFILNLIFRMMGVGVFSFLFLIIFRLGEFNLGYIVFFLWLGLYLIFAKEFVYNIKMKRERWGKIKHDLSLAVVRAPMTALNLIFIALFCYGIRVPLLLWVCLLAAWSIIPVNMLIDYLEKKQCS